MKMNHSVRSTSLLTRKKSLEPLHSFKKFPVFIGCTDQPRSKDIHANMNFDICTETGLIQLRKLIPLDLIYKESHSEAVGGVWKEHHDQFSKFVGKYKLAKILEIGGSNGVIAKKIIDKNPHTTITIVEPSPSIKSIGNITVIKDYFNEKFRYKKQVDAIIHSHVLEHLLDPSVSLKQIHDFLPMGAKQLFSIPNLEKWLSKKFPNTLNFEHTVFLSEYFTDCLLKKNGFKIIEKQYFGDHSIFYATEKVNHYSNLVIKNKYIRYKKMFNDLVHEYENSAEIFNRKIDKFNGEVYLFGAHIFSQFLIYFGLDQKNIPAILDNAKSKENKRLYGTNLFVKNPNYLKNKKKVAVIVKAGSYTQEIKNQLKKINKSVVIW